METNAKFNSHATGPSPCEILVTGGGGFLGRAIASLLSRQGHNVSSFSRGAYPDLERTGVRHVQGDLADLAAVRSAVRGKEIVFHAAARPGVWGPYRDFHVPNVVGTENIIKACLEFDVSRLIYTSSPSVVFDGSDIEGADESLPYPAEYSAYYPQTKAMAEKAVRKASSKIGVVCLRPHLIWGPGDNHLVPRILARGKAKRLVRVGDGKNLVDVVYIDNAADAHVLAAQKLSENPDLSGNVYFVSQGEPVRLWDMVDAILLAGGIAPVKHSVSPETACRIGAFFEKFYRTFHIVREPPMTRFVAEELSRSHWFDISAAKKDLGYVPKISVEEGLKLLAEDLSRQKARDSN